MAAPFSLAIETLRSGYESRETTPADVVESIFATIEQRGDDAVWIHRLNREQLLDHVRQIEAWKTAGKDLPLYGIPFAIKDNIDLAGHPTTAACPAYTYTPKRSATAGEKTG